ncbi:Protein of unknown function [Gryllus bimaculatus]|nr:Protein of unknown function [Gryllus bimaculatus]
MVQREDGAVPQRRSPILYSSILYKQQSYFPKTRYSSFAKSCVTPVYLALAVRGSRAIFLLDQASPVAQSEKSERSAPPRREPMGRRPACPPRSGCPLPPSFADSAITHRWRGGTAARDSPSFAMGRRWK